MNKKEKAARQTAWYREQINAILSGPGIAASVIGGIAEELGISEQPPDDWEPTPLTTEKLSALVEACEFYSEARLSAATATTEFDVIDAEHRMREGLKRIEAATAAARSSAKKSREVSSCPNCPLTDGGEEWQGVCHANPLKPRALPKNHDPDGPPPKWCPLPITITRKPRAARGEP